MPLTKVHLRRGSSIEKRRAIADAVQQALVSNLGISEQDRFLVFAEYEDGNFVHTSSFDAFGLTYTDDLLMIEISVVAGRSDEVKNKFLADLNRRLVDTAGVRRDDVFVMAYDSPAYVSFGQGLPHRDPAKS
jgi:phenylpyruvate tautomerase PptA (4-oxalocrotonate tautomerase family)